ncbi:SOS response-associated peptidase [uncultured Gelidibacter sp.]|uniref:SOS response-associated peptidase n=1 Tax=uncultured Gelidibacter sp. TaxID=259318 RepID=UPI00261F0F2C|nr:SOS response-associated peptidase [uncultured Gelidibacter sp.]
MCYDVKISLESQLKRAARRGDASAVDEIMEKLIPLTDLPLFHASGFTHPEVLIYTDRSPDYPEVATWGLVPHWVNDAEQLKKTWNTTLNARGETIFKKPSFRESAKNSRCLIYADGFYEHRHFNKKTYPYFIFRKDKEPMIFAGLYSEWTNPEHGGKLNTFSIVTTTANTILSKIHNNPKLKEPRMPVILPDALADKWLIGYDDPLDKTALEDLIKAYPHDALDAYTVTKLRGKDYMGNTEEISEPLYYEELPALEMD